MEKPYLTVGELRNEIKDFSADWAISFTLEGNPIDFNMVKVRGRKELNGRDLIQIDFVRGTGGK
jgi:hypothetical protein